MRLPTLAAAYGGEKMTEELRSLITKNVEALMAAPMCCPEAKDAGQAWLDAKGGPSEDQVAKELVAELQADILPVDAAIKMLRSDEGRKTFGDHAAPMLEHFEKIKSEGRLYCDCQACLPVSNILSRSVEITG